MASCWLSCTLGSSFIRLKLVTLLEGTLPNLIRVQATESSALKNTATLLPGLVLVAAPLPAKQLSASAQLV